MDISTQTVNDVTLVHLVGSLDTMTSGEASDEMTRIAKESNNMLLNLENLEFVSSSGLRVFLRSAKQLREAGGSLKMSNAKGNGKEVLEISGFGTILDIFDSESDALTNF